MAIIKDIKLKSFDNTWGPNHWYNKEKLDLKEALLTFYISLKATKLRVCLDHHDFE